jgi:hypothetical protein
VRRDPDEYQPAVIGTHFTGIILPEGKARCAPQCRHFKQSATLHSVPGIALRAAPARMNRFDAMK